MSGVSAKTLKAAVLDISTHNKRVDLSYEGGLDAENAYPKRFAIDLADYLNKNGFRHKSHKYQADKVLYQVKAAFSEYQRMWKYNVHPHTYSNTASTVLSTFEFDIKYILGNVRNALRFKIGKCADDFDQWINNPNVIV